MQDEVLHLGLELAELRETQDVDERSKLVSEVAQVDDPHAAPGFRQHFLWVIAVADRSLPDRSAFTEIVPLGAERYRRGLRIVQPKLADERARKALGRSKVRRQFLTLAGSS